MYNVQGLKRWFRKLNAVREEYGVVDQDIYNIDKTGFWIEVERKYRVIIKASSK
jgi:hypothetical protein